jgi:hypothetical protein
MVAYPFLPRGGAAEKIFQTAGYAASFLSSPVHNFRQYLGRELGNAMRAKNRYRYIA